ncbi:hypothetical protein [Microseira wollei]|nr:hypothetical protein [Microseira wollei]
MVKFLVKINSYSTPCPYDRSNPDQLPITRAGETPTPQEFLVRYN